MNLYLVITLTETFLTTMEYSANVLLLARTFPANVNVYQHVSMLSFSFIKSLNYEIYTVSDEKISTENSYLIYDQGGEFVLK